MGSKSYKKFERAYKKALQDYKYAINIGAYKYVGDYRDMVNNGVVELFKKFDLDDNNFEYGEILKLIKRATAWARIRKIRTTKNHSEMYNKTYLSEYELGLDAYKIFGVNDNSIDGSFDTNLFNTNFTLTKNQLEGFTRREEVEKGMFKTMRVADYAHWKEQDKLKKFIESEQKRLDLIYN